MQKKGTVSKSTVAHLLRQYNPNRKLHAVRG